MQFFLAGLLSLSLLQGAFAAPTPATTSAEISEQGAPSGSLERRFLGGYGMGAYGGVGYGGWGLGGGWGYPYGGGFMSGGSSGQSSSFNSNSMSSVGPFGYASSTSQAGASNSYSNAYGGRFFQKDAEAKKPTNTLERRFFGGYAGLAGYGGLPGYGYGFPYGGGFMSGGSYGQSSSFNSNSMASVGPFGYASSTSQAGASNSYSNTYGGRFFQKDTDAKKPTNES